jgi:hypothetical protein
MTPGLIGNWFNKILKLIGSWFGKRKGWTDEEPNTTRDQGIKK